MVEEFNKLAQELGHTPSQVVLAWLLAQGEDIFVIPGTTNQSR
jgi:aryl-alcohol dehydrogenase-like predicted oxidoreductase